MTWLPAKAAALLCGVSESAILKAVKQGKYEYCYVDGVGRGGKQLRIALESLPDHAQARYRGEQEQQPSDIRLSLTGNQREQLDFKQMVVLDYQAFKSTYPKADKRTAFLRQYNERHPDQTITKRQLNHWETLYNREGLAGLVDRRGGYNKGTSTIPEDVKQVFLAYWMQEKGNRRGGGGPSIASCYRLTQLNFPDQQLPSVAAFQRFVQTIPYAAKVLGREGKKAFADKCEPYIPFDYRSICTNEIWCADNHVFDLWVKDESGRVFKPWIVSWMDNNGVIYVEADVTTNSPRCVLKLILTAMGNEPKGSTADMMQLIISKLSNTNRLLIIDEAQHLTEKSFDAVRAIYDKAHIGIVYAGNQSIIKRMYGRQEEPFDQLSSRVTDHCRLGNCYTLEDIENIYKGEGFSRECIEHLYQISRHKGGLRRMVNQCKIAQNLAAALHEQFSETHLEKAAVRMGIGGII